MQALSERGSVMSAELLIYLYITMMVVMEWIHIGNDNINYYLNKDYFKELQTLEEGECE